MSDSFVQDDLKKYSLPEFVHFNHDTLQLLQFSTYPHAFLTFYSSKIVFMLFSIVKTCYWCNITVL